MTTPLSPALIRAIRVTVTGGAVAIASLAGFSLWHHFDADPWTRDGRVRADVIGVSADVSGLVTQVAVGNDQVVHRGDLLFVIDQARYQLALNDSEAALARATATVARIASTVARARAALTESQREATRNRGLGDLVPTEVTQQGDTKVIDAQGALGEAVAAQADAMAQARQAANACALARLNLERTRVVAPMDGVLADFSLRPGTYVAPGKPVLALVDSASLRVEGYFEENKLPGVHLGQRAIVRLMGEDQPLHGHVVSIASAIEDHDRLASTNGLPAINPSFSWVRLAQRVPVRIVLDRPPADVRLIAGRTASVALEPAP